MFDVAHDPPRRGLASWLGSAALHACAAILLFQFRGAILAPPVRSLNVTIITPSPARDTPKPAVLPKLPPRAFRLPPVPSQPARRPVLIEAPMVEAGPAPTPRQVPAEPALPPPPQIRTGVLDSPPPAPVPRPALTVETGVFSQNVRNEPKSDSRAAIQSAGFDGGASTTARAVGAGRASRVSEGAFGSASQGPGDGPKPLAQIAQAGFGDTVASKEPRSSARPAEAPPSDSTPLEITFQPRPAYTDEARRLQLQGEVVIEAVFTANGEVRVGRIVRGLGHGLNETALAAARSIRFRAAKQRGLPVDSAATIRMRFELAY